MACAEERARPLLAMDVVPLASEHLTDAVALIERLQSRREHHVAYLSVQADAIRQELEALPEEQLGAGVVLSGDGIRGVLVPEWATDPSAGLVARALHGPRQLAVGR